jgi:hypothetical protein
LDECQKLFTHAQVMLRDMKRSNSTDRAELVKAISLWQKSKEDWDAKNNALIDGSGYLRNAHGDMVFPEIPLALQRLERGGEWLEKSMNAAEQDQLRTSQDCIRQAGEAIHRARKALGRKYIEAD